MGNLTEGVFKKCRAISLVKGDFAPDKRKRVYYLSMTDLRTLSEMLQEALRRLKAIGEHL